MRPYLSPSVLFIPEYCDHQHQKETLHRIVFQKYYPKSHRVIFTIVCCECEEECGHKGEKISLYFLEWRNYIDSFVWESEELTNN